MRKEVQQAAFERLQQIMMEEKFSIFERDSTSIEVSKRRESIVEMKERFQEEQCEGD